MSKPKKIELVIANATKIHASDSLVVLIDPQFADWAQEVFDELTRLTGHDKHSIFPIPSDSVKFYRMENDIIISQNQMEMPISLDGPHLPTDELADGNIVEVHRWAVNNSPFGYDGVEISGTDLMGNPVQFNVPRLDWEQAQQLREYKVDGNIYRLIGGK